MQDEQCCRHALWCLDFFPRLAGLIRETHRGRSGSSCARSFRSVPVRQDLPTARRCCSARRRFRETAVRRSIAGIDCVFGIADKMVEQTGCRAWPPHLARTDRYPEVRAAVALRIPHHDLVCCGTMIDKAQSIAHDEHQSTWSLSTTRAGLVQARMVAGKKRGRSAEVCLARLLCAVGLSS